MYDSPCAKMAEPEDCRVLDLKERISGLIDLSESQERRIKYLEQALQQASDVIAEYMNGPRATVR